MLKISRESEINLINVLIDNDVISGKDLIDIKKKSTEGNKSQIESVFDLKLTDEKKILDILVKEQNLETVDLANIQITEDIKTVLPSNYIKVNFVAPFKIDGKTLHIAISDSSKLTLMRNLKAITKKNIELHAAPLTQISEFIERLSSESGEVTTDTIRQDNQEKQKTFDSDLGEAGEVLEKAPEEDIEAIENESEVIKFSTAVVAEAIKRGVSDIHIEPYRFSSRVRYRQDGMLQEQEQYKKFLHDNYGAVVTRFKIMGKLDIAERRLPQDGAINFKIEGKVVDLRLSILPTANNERIVMRILNKDAGDITLEQLNFDEQDLNSLRKGIHSTQGLILVTGPTGSGKSTTLAAIVNEINKTRTANILTVEDPVEFVHTDNKSIISHREVGKQTQSFANVLLYTYINPQLSVIILWLVPRMILYITRWSFSSLPSLSSSLSSYGLASLSLPTESTEATVSFKSCGPAMLLRTCFPPSVGFKVNVNFSIVILLLPPKEIKTILKLQYK